MKTNTKNTDSTEVTETTSKRQKRLDYGSAALDYKSAKYADAETGEISYDSKAIEHNVNLNNKYWGIKGGVVPYDVEFTALYDVTDPDFDYVTADELATIESEVDDLITASLVDFSKTVSDTTLRDAINNIEDELLNRYDIGLYVHKVFYDVTTDTDGTGFLKINLLFSNTSKPAKDSRVSYSCVWESDVGTADSLHRDILIGVMQVVSWCIVRQNVNYINRYFEKIRQEVGPNSKRLLFKASNETKILSLTDDALVIGVDAIRAKDTITVIDSMINYDSNDVYKKTKKMFKIGDVEKYILHPIVKALGFTKKSSFVSTLLHHLDTVPVVTKTKNTISKERQAIGASIGDIDVVVLETGRQYVGETVTFSKDDKGVEFKTTNAVIYTAVMDSSIPNWAVVEVSEEDKKYDRAPDIVVNPENINLYPRLKHVLTVSKTVEKKQ